MLPPAPGSLAEKEEDTEELLRRLTRFYTDGVLLPLEELLARGIVEKDEQEAPVKQLLPHI